MSNFLSKALMAIALDKKAREALKQSRQAKADAAKATKKPAAKATAQAAKRRPQPTAPAEKPAATAPMSVTDTLEQADKSERRELIRNAIKLRREKMSVLDDLSEEQRHALQIAALQAIIERSKAGGGGS